MYFKIRGNGEYKLKFEDNNVIKYSLTSNSRLIAAAQKQQDFKSNFFKSPTIHEITDSSFTMEYINGESFIDFFIRASKRDLDGLILKLDGYFKERIVGDYYLPIDIIIDKLKTLPNTEYLIDFLRDKKTIKIKAGLCHGDMTLSNMIFAEEIYLIDFLDSYMESPTMDILKLRQDTNLYWSFNMIDKVSDKIKLKIGLNYIDEWLNSTFDMEYYNLLQCINLHRIFPYAKDSQIVEYLNKNIYKLCEHL